MCCQVGQICKMISALPNKGIVFVNSSERQGEGKNKKKTKLKLHIRDLM